MTDVDGATSADRYRGLPPGRLPKVGGPARSTPPARPPVVRFDRIASHGPANLQGQVVDASRAPRGGTRILLVSAEERKDQHTLTTKRDGSFQTRVAAGGWLVYTYDSRGKPVFSRRIEVPGERAVSVVLTQR